MAFVDPLPPKPPKPPDVPVACIKQPDKDDIYCERLYRPSEQFVFTSITFALRHYGPSNPSLRVCPQCAGRVPKELL